MIDFLFSSVRPIWIFIMMMIVLLLILGVYNIKRDRRIQIGYRENAKKQLAENKRVLDTLSFYVFKNDFLFDSTNSELIEANNKIPEIGMTIFDPISASEIKVNHLYRSKATNKFYRYYVGIKDGKFYSESIQMVADQQIKEYLAENNMELYIKFFGTPSYY